MDLVSEPVVAQISDICSEDTLSRRWNVSNAVRDERQDSDGDRAGGFVTADPCPRQQAESDAHELHEVSSGFRLKRGRSHVSVGDSPVKCSLWGNGPISGQPRGLAVGLSEDSRSGCTGAGCAEEREYIELSDDDDCDDCTFTCELCGNFWPAVLACPMPTCHCQVCQLCMQRYAQVQIDGLTSCLEKMGDHGREEREGREKSDDVSDRIQCPCEGCGTDMPVLSCRFLAAESVAKWEEAATAALLRGDTETFVACPGCEVSIEKVPTEPPPGAVLSGVPELDRTAPFAELDDEGHVLSREAICHRAEHRYRCAMCSVDFCGSCKSVPYHLGFSCLDFKVRQEAARCRYCDTPLVPPPGPGGLASEQLSPQEWLARPVRELRKELGACQLDASWCLSKGDLWAVHTVAKAVCEDGDCKQKCKGACTRPLDCGHLCGGVRGETVCLPCLEAPCRSKPHTHFSSAFPTATSASASASSSSSGSGSGSGSPSITTPDLPSASDFCPICYVDPLQSAPCVRLSCTHVVHHHCARDRVQGGYPGPHLSFGFCSCPLCKTPMDHPSLTRCLQRPRQLEAQVKTLALERLEVERTAGRASQFPNEEAASAYALNQYRFYECARCHKPYFGGDRNCAPDVAQPQQPGVADGNNNIARAHPDPHPVPIPKQDLICGACIPTDWGSAKQAAKCQVPHHASYTEYKCKFCCNVAVFFCFGTTHFCKLCHIVRPDRPGFPIPTCPGRGKCPLNIPHPPNGVEFCLGCGLCRVKEGREGAGAGAGAGGGVAGGRGVGNGGGRGKEQGERSKGGFFNKFFRMDGRN